MLDAHGEIEGCIQPMSSRCCTCCSNSDCSCGVNLYCLAALGRAPGSVSIFISKPCAVVLGGAGPNVPPGVFCFRMTSCIQSGMFVVSCFYGAGACYFDKYPLFREDTALEHIDSTQGLIFTTCKGALPWLALLTNAFSSAGLAIKSSGALVSVVYL